MDELERAIHKVRKPSFAGRSLDDLTEEYNARLWWGKDTDENLDLVEALGNEIKARRSNLSQRVDQLERRVESQQFILIIIGMWAVWSLFTAAYGKEAMAAWSPVVLVAGVIWFLYSWVRRYFRTRKYRR